MKRMMIVCVVLMLCGCERMFMSATGDVSDSQVFDCLWKSVDERYSQFASKGVDWQAVYDTMRPKVWDGMGDDSLFSVCANMLSLLRDGHVNLYGRYDVSHSDSVYQRFYDEGQIDIDAVVLGYLGAGYRTTGGIAWCGLDEGRVVYMRYSSFNGDVSVAGLRHIMEQFPDARGIIFDIRGNGGGSMTNVYNILRFLPSKGQHLYSSQIKNGVGHGDFSDLSKTYAPKVADGLAFDGRVVVLTDRGCYSAASMFALCCKAYESVVLMGDTTSGGLGLPCTYLLPNGWRYRLPVTRIVTPAGENWEEGLPVDVVVRLDTQRASRERKDNIIETAIEMLEN